MRSLNLRGLPVGPRLPGSPPAALTLLEEALMLFAFVPAAISSHGGAHLASPTHTLERLAPFLLSWVAVAPLAGDRPESGGSVPGPQRRGTVICDGHEAVGMSNTASTAQETAADPVEQSAAFLLAVRRGESTETVASALAGVASDTLAAALDTDGARVAFWTNVYNAATQRALAEDPGQYDSRRAFFSTSLVTVAGRELSLDEIEHGILRRSHSVFTLGLVRTPGPFRDDYIDTHAPDERDPRIHFALNCAADSCPPIAAYTREEIDAQLDLATRGYLDQHVEYDPDARGRFGGLRDGGRALVPRVMLWFRGDFGGRHGVVEMLRRRDQVPPGVDPRLSYREWDWSFDPADYADEAYAPERPESKAQS